MDNIAMQDGFLGQRMIVLPNTIKKRLISNQITSSFYITDIGYYPHAHNHYRVRKNGAQEYIFIYCIEGRGVMKIDGNSIEVTPNSFLIIPKNTPHLYESNKQNPWSIYWMHFDGNSAEMLYERHTIQKRPIDAIPFKSERIELFDKIYQMLQNDYTSTQLEYANVLGLRFVCSFIYAEADQITRADNPNNLIDNVIQFLNDNLDKSYKSDDIAEQFNYSPSHLFNIFKKRTGYSLIHFFNLKKIQKSCEYLKYTDLSVKEISYKMSFQDPLYFSRLFKRYMGLSPRAYKKSQRSNL